MTILTAQQGGESVTTRKYYQRRYPMALSARNTLKGKVKAVKKGQVMAEVVVEVAPGVEIVATITTSSVERLNLTVGKEVEAIVKATSVMING